MDWEKWQKSNMHGLLGQRVRTQSPFMCGYVPTPLPQHMAQCLEWKKQLSCVGAWVHMSKRMSNLGWQYSEKSRTRATNLGSSAWGQELKLSWRMRALKWWGWSEMMMTMTRTTTKTTTSSQPHWWQQARHCVKCTLYPRENPMTKVLLLSPHYRQDN